MNKNLTFIALSLMAFCAFSTFAQNPLLRDWSATGGIPPFNEIKPTDFIPAYETALAEEREEIAAIVHQEFAPNYLNTIRRLTLAGAKVERIRLLLVNLVAADLTPEIEAVSKTEAKLLAARESEIYSNEKLFARVAKVYARKDLLNPERERVTEAVYHRFILAGAKLSEADRNRLREIKERLSVLSRQFLSNYNAECRDFEKKFGFGIAKFSREISKTDDRAVREKMYRAYENLCRTGNEHDNRAIAVEILKLRHEWATKIGYRTSAEMYDEPTMAKSPQKALAMMESIFAQAKSSVERMRDELEKLAGFKLEPWDWAYYSRKLQQSKFNFDPEELRAYLPRERVFDAARGAAKAMYGINAEKLPNAPSFAPGKTEAWRFTDADGSLLGTLIYDYLPRPTKHAGAWIENYVYQYRDADGREIRPVASQSGSIEGNFTLNNVRTVFHEFGHALQVLLSQCEDMTLSGINGTPDYTEIFSQFNQEIGCDPSYLLKFAANEKGEKPPRELIERVTTANKVGRASGVQTSIAAAILDIKLHEITNFENLDLDDFQRKVEREIGLIPELRLRMSAATFRHTFVHEYEAKYFTYIWSRVLSEDLLNEFRKKRDLLNPDLAFKFRRAFLETGFGRDPMECFHAFMRREPKIEPYLKALGLTAEAETKSEGDEPGQDNFGVYDYVKDADGTAKIAPPPADALYRNPNAPIEERIEDVLKYMTPLEKMQILHTTSAGSAGDIPRLGLPNFRLLDGPNGVRCDQPITYFPSCIAYAAAFDRELAFAVGRAMGAETRAVVDERTGEVTRCLLGPGCDIARSPTGARNFEYFGEDPILSGETAAAFCMGLQSVKVAPALKHYVLNDQEWYRTAIDVNCGERALREIYERPFAIACKKADVWTIMNSYNQVNGSWASHALTANNHLREIGWTGALMPDWGGTHGFTPAINGGTSFQTAVRKDLARDRELLKDLKSGKLNESRFEAALRETLRFFFRVGAFDGDSPEEQKLQAECKKLYRSEEHRRLAYRAAAESMVLIKNEKQFLPLNRAKVKKVCVLGPNANFQHTMISGKDLRQCGGSGAILAGREPTPLEVAREYFGAENVSTRLADARKADVVFYFGGFNHYTDREVLGGPQTPADRADISLDHQQLVELQQLSAYTRNVVIALTTGAPVQCNPWLEKVNAAFVTWYAGEEGPIAFYDAVFGKVNPSGKLPFTFGYKLSDWYCHRLGEKAFPGVTIPRTAEGVQAREEYADGIFVGYRGFDKFKIKPQFPFGFGLSYTDFELSNPVVGKESVKVEVANIGEVKGRAVVQLYISKLAGEGEQLPEMPEKELASFESVELEPGEIKTVELKYGFDELKYYDEREQKWLLPGACRFFIGQHSDDRAIEGVLFTKPSGL